MTHAAAALAAMLAACTALSGCDREGAGSAGRELLADVPLVPLYFHVSKHLVAPHVEGWYDNVMNVTYSKDLALREGQEPEP